MKLFSLRERMNFSLFYIKRVKLPLNYNQVVPQGISTQRCQGKIPLYLLHFRILLKNIQSGSTTSRYFHTKNTYFKLVAGFTKTMYCNFCENYFFHNFVTSKSDFELTKNIVIWNCYKNNLTQKEWNFSFKEWIFTQKEWNFTLKEWIFTLKRVAFSLF